jgi:hypothetical protein
MFDFVLLGFYQIFFLYMFVSFYTILKQSLKMFWSSTPTNFSYEPPLFKTRFGDWVLSLSSGKTSIGSN